MTLDAGSAMTMRDVLRAIDEARIALRRRQEEEDVRARIRARALARAPRRAGACVRRWRRIRRQRPAAGPVDDGSRLRRKAPGGWRAREISAPRGVDEDKCAMFMRASERRVRDAVFARGAVRYRRYP